MSNSEEMRKIMKLMEAANNVQEIDMDFDNVESRLMRVTADVARTWKSQATAGYKERPSGPDTSKFIARSYGMIEPAYNIDIPEGMFNRRYVAFLKIGSNIDISKRREIISDYEETIDVELGIDLTNGNRVVTSDGVKLYYNQVSGSAWGGAGFFRQ